MENNNVEVVGIDESRDMSNVIEAEVIKEEPQPEFTLPERVCVYCGTKEEVYYCDEKYHILPVPVCLKCAPITLTVDRVMKKMCQRCASHTKLMLAKELCEYYIEELGNTVICRKNNEIFRHEFDKEVDFKKHVIGRCKGNKKYCSMYQDLRVNKEESIKVELPTEEEKNG